MEDYESKEIAQKIVNSMERNGVGNADSSTITNFLGYW